MSTKQVLFPGEETGLNQLELSLHSAFQVASSQRWAQLMPASESLHQHSILLHRGHCLASRLGDMEMRLRATAEAKSS